jgi:hypothetical protein
VTEQLTTLLEESLMPGPSDHLDPNKTILHLEKPKDHLDPNQSVPHLETLDISWAVLDVGTNEVAQFAADGGHFQSLEGHRYIVFVRAADVNGVQRAALDGFGMFRCSTDADKDGVFHEAELPLPASIPHQEIVSTGGAPTLQTLVAVMKPDIGAFDYFRLSGGFHHFNGTSENLEYFAFSGLMTFSAAATNSRGDRRTASLTTAA